MPKSFGSGLHCLFLTTFSYNFYFRRLAFFKFKDIPRNISVNRGNFQFKKKFGSFWGVLIKFLMIMWFGFDLNLCRNFPSDFHFFHPELSVK